MAARLLAIQGQDPRGARLAVRARTAGLSAADVDRQLGSEQRSMLIAWLNRGTLHLVRSEDYPWLHALTTPPLINESARRLGVEGISASEGERALATIERALADSGPQTRAQLRERLAAKGLPSEGQALFHLLFRAGVLGMLVRGPVLGRDHAFVLVRDWLGEAEALDRDQALAELARRFLVGHQPATDRDLAKWAGLALRDARAGLRAIGAEVEVDEAGLVRLAGRRDAGLGQLPAPRLLGAFDPVLFGWTSREAIVGPHRQLLTANGLFRPFAMVNGRAVAGWRLVRDRVAIEPLEGIAKRDRAALDADAADVERFMAGPSSTRLSA
ncbi:MAG: winged helix DNA-binding domain-containing protein [Solirubrobacterales bacterium]